MTQYLVLFDVDGTLLLTQDELYVEANREAMTAVYGTAPEALDTPGDTALANTRRTLRSAGRGDGEIDAGLAHWCSAFSQRYIELLSAADPPGWRAAPDAAETLAAVDRRALLTGNPEEIAHARMHCLGLASFFPSGQGAFGCEHEHIVELFDLARERANAWPARRTLRVADTPLDVENAHAAGALAVAITTGRYEANDLVAADAVIERLGELPDVLASL